MKALIPSIGFVLGLLGLAVAIGGAIQLVRMGLPKEAPRIVVATPAPFVATYWTVYRRQP